MFIGPVFAREAAIIPRRPRLYALRTVYASSLFILMCTAWLVLAGTQRIQNIGDMARFGAILFQILAPLQLAVMLFLSALQSASVVSLEKDRKTLILLLLTRMTNSELVLGKLLGSLITTGAMLLTAVPIFMLICLFGGVSFEQVAWVFAVTASTALVAASLGSTMALWREKTFQTLALIAIIIVFWIGFWEVISYVDGGIAGFTYRQLANWFSPLRAIVSATSPVIEGTASSRLLPFVISSVSIAVLLNLVAILQVRKWNPSREVRPGQMTDEHEASIWGVDHDLQKESESNKTDEDARLGHVDARVRTASQKSRIVGDNPVLWRETNTWAYGKKILVVKAIYVLLAIAVAFLANHLLNTELATTAQFRIHPLAGPLAPFFLVSLVIVNALAVNSITNERDGLSLDLLLVTDLSPKEFLFGKLFGVLYVAREMVLLPMVLCILAWFKGAFSLEILIFLLVGLGVMNIFVATLGIHCGMNYANSRQAIGVSLGTVFFLFLGIVTCMVMMISFSGSFQSQLTPFLAFIVGGAIGLYIALGYRLRSSAMALACGFLPLAMFFAITSLILGRSMSVFFVIVVIYGFTTFAMLMPALGEYNIAMGGRAKAAEDE